MIVRATPDGRVCLWCPACDDLHQISIDTPTGWMWDGDADAPTISPSIKVSGHQWDPSFGFYKPQHAQVPTGGATICHSFVKAGRWECLGDSTHALAGQTVDVVPIPPGYFDEA